MPTDEELNQLQRTIERKRGQIADAQAKAAERQTEMDREILFKQLQAEEAKLDVELARAREQAKVAGSKDAAASVLDAATAQLEQARVLADAPVGPVDTNAENPPKDTGATKAVEGGTVETAPDGTTTVVKPDNTDKNGGNS